MSDSDFMHSRLWSAFKAAPVTFTCNCSIRRERIVNVVCSREFRSQSALNRHRRATGHFEPYFTLYAARHINPIDVTCADCNYRPDKMVDNPVKCYKDHRRRRHFRSYCLERAMRNPYVIAEEP